MNTEQIVSPVGMTEDGSCLKVESILPKSLFDVDGSNYGYQYEWRMNHYTYSGEKENVMTALGLNEKEYEYWDNQFIKRFDHEKDEWYTKKI